MSVKTWQELADETRAAVAEARLAQRDQGRYPLLHFRQHRRAVELRDSLPQAERPWDPRHRIPDAGGTLRPECFGRHGYGAGVLDRDGWCGKWGCPDSNDCYATFRTIVEDGAGPRAAAMNRRLGELRASGLDSRQAMQVAAIDGTPLPMADAHLLYLELGQGDRDDSV